MMNISDYADKMLSYKEKLGFSRGSYEYYVRDFCRYFCSNGFSKFTEESVLPWCVRRESETPEGFRRRITPLREFSKYMCAIGAGDYIIPTSILPITHREMPYIFTDLELQRFFKECDKELPSRQSPCRHLIIQTIFKTIYFCGLRPNEARELTRSDFNSGEGTLLIRNNKARKERKIPVSEDILAMLRMYIKASCAVCPDTEYLFPSPDGNPYTRRWLSDTFRRIWTAANPDSCAKNVRVYLLRHRFATAVFTGWFANGENLYAKMPYLSAYMGHSRFEDTAYYIHLLPEKLLASSTIDWNKFNNLIPEVEDNDR